jgi:hypothetical protein
MDRRAFIVTLAGGLLAAPLAAEAQLARVYHIGVILHGGLYFSAIDGLRDGLRELGLEEGKQFVPSRARHRRRSEVGGGCGEGSRRAEG